MQYYGTRLSENISRREPEGYLLCLNVPVARSGTQDYRPDEVGMPPSGGIIPVLRPEEEVFSPAAVASFEGMPVTNDHPPAGVDIRNIRALQKGHAHNVRRGSGKEKDLLLADLIITDPVLIGDILGGKREISCGYTYELCEENGQYIQRNIRGNHVAVVDAGRAGPRVSIKDHIMKGENTMKRSLYKVLARMAKDGDLETVAGILEEMLQPEDETPAGSESVTEEAAEAVESPAAVIETEEATVTVDEVTLADITARLDQIIALLAPAAADEEAEGQIPAEQVAAAVGEAVEAVTEAAAEGKGITTEKITGIVEEILDPAVSGTVAEETGTEGDEDPEQEVICSTDALKAALTAVRPALAKMPKKQRQRVCEDIALRLRDRKRPAADAKTYAALASARRRPSEDEGELGRRIMASRNANRAR